MIFVYDLIFILFAILYVPYLTIKGKWHRGLIVRMGFFPQELRSRLEGRQAIWVHAVSVGEVLVVLGLIDRLKKAFPRYRIILTTVTPTGYHLACSKLSSEDVVLYAPLDFSVVVRRFLVLLNPVLYVSAETEIWPGLFTALHHRGIPIVQVNGRISEKSFRRYRRVRFLIRPVLDCVRLFCVQTPDDARRLTDLGASPQRVTVVGNMKFDFAPLPAGPVAALKGLSHQSVLWIAGSTHPGEEEIILDIYRGLLRELPNLRLLIAPRHVERVPQIEKFVRAGGHTPVRFSASPSRDWQGGAEIVIVDAIGHLRSLYTRADIVFIGKSLTGRGGQNVIEPAAMGKAVVVGPHMQNFEGIMASFLHDKAILQVPDAAGLRAAIHCLAGDAALRCQLGERALKVVAGNRGVTDKTAALLQKVLPE